MEDDEGTAEAIDSLDRGMKSAGLESPPSTSANALAVATTPANAG
jgi:hypothetical protein